MNLLPATLLPLFVGLTIASAETALEQVGDEQAFGMSLGASLLAAGVTSLLRAAPSGPPLG